MFWHWKSIPIALLLCAFGGCAFGQDNSDEESVCIDGGCPADATAPTVNYAEIYQAIWDADQDLNGIPSILATESRDENRGYVVVEEPLNWDNNKDLKILSKVVIPESKIATYKLIKALFDNYTLDQSKPETPQTVEEKAEIAAFINAIKDLEPMKLAREFIEAEKEYVMTDDEWYDSIYKIWFEIYDFRPGSTPHRSGFEHVIVGEQNGDRLGGYHFWYKYWLDDNAVEGYANEQDNMDYNGTRYFGNTAEGVVNTNAVTLSHYWDAVDYENDKKTERLSKRTGGFDVGCSPEGLIALGMVCFHDPRSRKTAVIDHVKLEFKLFKAGPENSSINTFYSKFKGFTVIPVPVDDEPNITNDATETTSSPDIRIVAALVNPDGDDSGKETVSLINTSDRSIDLKGWTVAGNNGSAFKLIDAKLNAGEIRTFKIPAKSAQFTNKTAKITLKDANRKIIDVVNYDKKDIKSGHTVVF